MAEPFQLLQVEAGPRTTVLRVQGHLDARSTPVLLETSQSVKRAGKCLVLNLAEVTFIASSGVGGLLSLPEEFHEVGLTMCFASLSPAVESVIRLLNLQNYLEITPSEDAALDVMGR
jgi:stage II sporulation protein AA (anti-sigma F factor antagonist)